MLNLKIAVVGLPGKWSTETLADAVEKKTGFRLIVDMDKVVLNLDSLELTYQGHNLCQLDAIIIKKIGHQYSPNSLDRLELLRVAENAGVKVFSQPVKILRLIDRLSCTVTLRNADIPMPATVITEEIDEAIAAVNKFGSAIFKPLYSTKARGMCVISKKDGKTKVRKNIEAFKTANPMMYIQQKAALGGRDMGLMFLGGRYLGAYARVSKNDAWNTTINSGGEYAAADPSTEIIAMASKAQDLFDMSYTTVDVAETDKGAIVFEVSAFGGFRGGKEGLNLDVAELYVDFVLTKLEQKTPYVVSI
ncbi:glutathione synthase [Methyloprofundus sedimenti]|uniref:Glutathione synthase n=1 Tax=Methyloprofundus sedimenti TaxID=1420851 RepID=A0A1V8MA37_9GAMM|nr:GAK system ATP-grasp enzyme [Methyloprofundus sedimenti]OQK18396.1 glutathione synthase [Methyloprofundus sedimenti]